MFIWDVVKVTDFFIKYDNMLLIVTSYRSAKLFSIITESCLIFHFVYVLKANFRYFFFYKTKSTALPTGIFDKGWKQFYERYTKKMLTVVHRYLYIIHLKILILNSSIVTFRYTAELKNKLDSFQPSSSSQFPAYRNYKTRVLSFGEILSTEMIEDLAAFGFFYEGKNFRVYILVEIYCCMTRQKTCRIK